MSMTNIEWTDRVWNPVTGCSKVSPGCKFCYAEGVAHRFWATQYPQVPVSAPADLDATNTFHRPRRFTDVMTHADRLLEPLSWRTPQRVFVNSMSDLFHEDVPDQFIDQVFAVMALASQHTFQVLTKRPARMLAYFESFKSKSAVARAVEACQFAHTARRAMPSPADFDAIESIQRGLPNVWLGVSVEDQQRADERIPLLLQTPAAVRFISAEPLLGPVDLLSIPRAGKHHDYLTGEYQCSDLDKHTTNRLDWVIIGGESGPGARPFRVEWAEDLVRQCQAAAVRVFVKQLGAVPLVLQGRLRHWEWGSAIRSDRAAKFLEDGPTTWRVALDDRKGGDMAEWPASLRVREFPR